MKRPKKFEKTKNNFPLGLKLLTKRQNTQDFCKFLDLSNFKNPTREFREKKLYLIYIKKEANFSTS